MAWLHINNVELSSISRLNFKLAQKWLKRVKTARKRVKKPYIDGFLGLIRIFYR